MFRTWEEFNSDRENPARARFPGSNIINHNRDDSFRFRLDGIVAIKPLRCGGDQ
jgi:hypothetical protein